MFDNFLIAPYILRLSKYIVRTNMEMMLRTNETAPNYFHNEQQFFVEYCGIRNLAKVLWRAQCSNAMVNTVQVEVDISKHIFERHFRYWHFQRVERKLFQSFPFNSKYKLGDSCFRLALIRWKISQQLCQNELSHTPRGEEFYKNVTMEDGCQIVTSRRTVSLMRQIKVIKFKPITLVNSFITTWGFLLTWIHYWHQYMRVDIKSISIVCRVD